MSTSSASPYLTIVSTSRNDDHGGNTLQRTQVSLTSLLEQLEHYRIESELILVEWNPPADKPRLKDVIRWPGRRLKYCTIRNIVVPPAIHHRYPGADKIPMYAVAAVNCGVRRARGEFVLPRSIDIIYPEELMAYLASRSLKQDERYRVDRCDVDRNVVGCGTLTERLDYCRKNVIKVNVTHEPGRPAGQWKGGLPALHTNASGDFQLMSRQWWRLLRGYREADIPSAYVDNLLSYASYAAGVREVVLNGICIYHIDHDNKFNDWLERTKLPLEKWVSVPFLPLWFNTRLLGIYRRVLMLFGYKMKSSMCGVPTLDYAENLKMCKGMVAGKRSNIINDENWGLGQDTLEEFVINIADWDKDYGKN